MLKLNNIAPCERDYSNSIANAEIKMTMIEYTLWLQMHLHFKLIQLSLIPNCIYDHDCTKDKILKQFLPSSAAAVSHLGWAVLAPVLIKDHLLSTMRSIAYRLDMHSLPL